MQTRTRLAIPTALTIGALLALAAMVASCASPPVHVDPPAGAPSAPPPSPTYDYDHQLRPTTTRPGDGERKPVVALLRADDLVDFGHVVPFGRKKAVIVRPNGQPERIDVVGAADMPVLLPLDVRQFLLKELVDCRHLIVVDRERILEILRELAFSASKLVDPASAPRTGRIIGVHYILEAAFFPAGSRPAIEADWIETTRIGPWRKQPVNTSACALYLNAYDVETGQVKAVGFGSDENRALACRRAVEDLLSQLARVNPPIRLVRFDEQGGAVLDIGSQSGVKPGARFRIPTTPDQTVLLEVWKADPLTCQAKFVQGRPEDVSAGAVAHFDKQ